jgi:hypothetical protein
VLDPVDPDQALIDFAELSRSGQRVQLQIAAANRDMVEGFVTAIEKAGLSAVACEIEPLAESRALLIPRLRGKAQAIVNLGAETTTFIAASGPDVFFMRVIGVGTHDFTRAVAKEMGCSFVEAEKLKARSGLRAAATDPTLEAERFEACQTVLLDVSDQLAQTLADSRKFYEATSNGRPVVGLTVLGPGARLDGLSEELASQLALAIDEGALPRENLNSVKDFEEFTSSMGLALGHQMSLLPEVKHKSFAMHGRGQGKRLTTKIAAESSKETKERARRLRSVKRARAPKANPVLVGLAIGMIAAAGSYYYAGKLDSQNAALRKEVKSAQSKQAVAQSRLQAPQYQVSKGGPALASQRTAALLVGRPNLAVLSSVIAVGRQVGVTEAGLVLAGGQRLDYSGVVKDPADVDTVQAKLAATPGIGEVRLGLTAPHPGGGSDFTVSFSAPYDIRSTTS